MIFWKEPWGEEWAEVRECVRMSGGAGDLGNTGGLM